MARVCPRTVRMLGNHVPQTTAACTHACTSIFDSWDPEEHSHYTFSGSVRWIGVALNSQWWGSSFPPHCTP
eukprot:1469256-Prymnesium_polylepis.1